MGFHRHLCSWTINFIAMHFGKRWVKETLHHHAKKGKTTRKDKSMYMSMVIIVHVRACQLLWCSKTPVQLNPTPDLWRTIPCAFGSTIFSWVAARFSLSVLKFSTSWIRLLCCRSCFTSIGRQHQRISHRLQVEQTCGKQNQLQQQHSKP